MLETKRTIILFVLAAMWLAACVSESAAGRVATHSGELSAQETAVAWIAANRDPDVPPLPFPDNPDPDQCGIPTAWGDGGIAWLSGIYEGELVQPTIMLYDSHSRLRITAEAPHGAQVQIILYQQNPILDYYLIKIKGAPKPNEGWVPGPFLSFEPVAELEDLPNN